VFPGWDFPIFVAALSVAAFTPGPGLAAIVASVLAQGARKTVWFCAGVIVGDLFWLTLSLSGLALIAQQIPIVFVTIKWAGVSYLIWLAWKTWNANPDFGQIRVADKGHSPIARAGAGFAITLGNPKAMLFYMALLPSLLNTGDLSLIALLPYYVAVFVVLTTVFAVYVIAAQSARRAMKNTRAVRKFNRITATALGGAAVWIASR
jgi:threonine/homoserine/homoserine lactone efflux protein